MLLAPEDIKQKQNERTNERFLYDIVRPNEPYGLRGRKDLLNRASIS